MKLTELWIFGVISVKFEIETYTSGVRFAKISKIVVVARNKESVARRSMNFDSLARPITGLRYQRKILNSTLDKSFEKNRSIAKPCT